MIGTIAKTWRGPEPWRRQCDDAFPYSGSHVAGIAEVSVNRSTGEIKVHNFWCTIDCGVAVQPDNVIAQQESSIV